MVSKQCVKTKVFLVSVKQLENYKNREIQMFCLGMIRILKAAIQCI